MPELVEAVVDRMLEKDPELRYQTCGEVISDLKGIRKEMVGIRVEIGMLKVKAGVWGVIGGSIPVLIGALIYNEPLNEAKIVGFVFIWTALIIYSIESIKMQKRNSTLQRISTD